MDDSLGGPGLGTSKRLGGEGEDGLMGVGEGEYGAGDVGSGGEETALGLGCEGLEGK